MFLVEKEAQKWKLFEKSWLSLITRQWPRILSQVVSYLPSESCGRHGGLMVSALDSGSSGIPGPSWSKSIQLYPVDRSLSIM